MGHNKNQGLSHRFVILYILYTILYGYRQYKKKSCVCSRLWRREKHSKFLFSGQFSFRLLNILYNIITSGIVNVCGGEGGGGSIVPSIKFGHKMDKQVYLLYLKTHIYVQFESCTVIKKMFYGFIWGK